MALHQTLGFQHLFCPTKQKTLKNSPCHHCYFASTAGTTNSHWFKENPTKIDALSRKKLQSFTSNSPSRLRPSCLANKKGAEADDDSDGPLLMDEEERREWRSKIRQVIDMNPNVQEEVDPVERQNKLRKLLADYPLVVEEEDPDWPEDAAADGWGFSLGQFFNKITIKNVNKDDDENCDGENELVWQDDDYIRPIKDITTREWEETVFKDISPLVVLVHNRYKRPKENERMRNELENAVHIIWNCRLPSPRCVAIDAVVELDLVAALQVSAFPELIFTKAGKILYREKAIRSADELSKMMAFFYYGAAKPPILSSVGKSEELIPTLSISSEQH
ncbi:thioredoxin-like fold domain-containing protein MRL7L, chloroplastic [Diospyros lotus]|uniref:thioredoxin-like fold domain-containing protein MRL7L, chloroplastic n=1 Tax=Diospyros lotus TaxID=55363 RepID=UPI002258F4D6|nr:thioredoxin-like fold domain-containing protein MRL7L, chloroplastic [Diospyros lotus]